jgi:hypothetical protein
MKITLKELRSIVKQVVNEARSEEEKAAARLAARRTRESEKLSVSSPYLSSREIPELERPRITDTRIADAEQQLELRISEQQNAFNWLLNLKDTQPERFIELLDERNPNLVDYGFTGSEASQDELKRFIITLQNQLKRLRNQKKD